MGSFQDKKEMSVIEVVEAPELGAKFFLRHQITHANVTFYPGWYQVGREWGFPTKMLITHDVMRELLCTDALFDKNRANQLNGKGRIVVKGYDGDRPVTETVTYQKYLSMILSQ